MDAVIRDFYLRNDYVEYTLDMIKGDKKSLQQISMNFLLRMISRQLHKGSTWLEESFLVIAI